MNNILFRADSSSIIGTGHIMRDLVLAKKYPDSDIIFATQDLKGNLNSKILENGYKVEILNTNKLNELIFLIKKLDIDMVVIDHYEIDYEFEKNLKENTSINIMVLDDTYEKHYCDILLNHNISGDKKRYKGLVPKNCELRCGAKYVLLREEFYIQKNKIYKLNKKKNIFLAMGGADHSNINIKVLEVLGKFPNIEINLATTTTNQNLQELKDYCKAKKWINLHINSNIIAKLMKKSNFSIVTPSVILNEIYFMRVPFIAIQTAINQKDMYEFIKKEKKLTLRQFNKNKLKDKLCKIL